MWKKIGKGLRRVIRAIRDPILRPRVERVAEKAINFLIEAYPVLDFVTDLIPGRADDVILDLTYKYAVDAKVYIGMTAEERKSALYAIARKKLREVFPQAVEFTDAELDVVIAFAVAASGEETSKPS